MTNREILRQCSHYRVVHMYGDTGNNQSFDAWFCELCSAEFAPKKSAERRGKIEALEWALPIFGQSRHAKRLRDELARLRAEEGK